MKCIDSQFWIIHSFSPIKRGQFQRVEPINISWFSGGSNGFHNSKVKHKHNYIISQPYLKSKLMAIPSSLVLGATKPPGSGDVSVLLQTGGLLLVFYVLANFVVPQIIMNNMESDEEDDDQKTKEIEEASTNVSRDTSKGRGFNSDRRK